MTDKNIYKVSRKQWSALSPEQREIYNLLRDTRKDCVLPVKVSIEDKDWNTICHNFSYIASTYF